MPFSFLPRFAIFFLHLMMFHRAHLLFNDCPLLKRRDFLSRGASYDIMMVVITSKTLLVTNQPNYCLSLLFHPHALLLFAVLHQNDFCLFQYFQHWMDHVINLQQQNIFFPLINVKLKIGRIDIQRR